MTWCVLDLETNNHEYFGSLASPHQPDNYIVAAGWCIDNQEVQHEYFNNATEAAESNWLERALDGQKVLVAHNLTFEMHWLLKHYRSTMLEFLKRGGKVFCTQYAEFLLSHQLDMYPKLEDCSIKYGGTKKIDEVKLLWKQGILTADIDKALIVEYLADPVVGDVANTRLVCFKQVAEAKRLGMYEMMQVRMDSLLFNAFCTFNGLYVDTDIAYKNQAEQEARILEIKEGIINDLPTDLPSELQFSFTSPYHMSAFLYGGTVKYDKKVSYEPKKYVKVDAYEYIDPLDKHSEYFPVGDDVFKHPETTLENITKFKLGKNKGLPKVFKVDSDVELLKWGIGEYTFKGIIDLTKLPAIAKDQFLGKRAEFRGKRFLADGTTPVYSTGKDALDLLSIHKIHQAQPLKELANLVKDVGTYYLQTDANGKQSGMLQFVEPNGIIHHQLNSCTTVTGRLSGSKPNMQNLPRGGTSRVKAMFVSRFGKDGRMTENDFGALEVVNLAAISNDQNLLGQIIGGTDMHCYRLAAQLDEPYESVLEKCKNKEHPDHVRYDEMRTAIKPKAFSNQYGASAMGIAMSTGCTVQEAEEFKANELLLFPESSTFAELNIRPEVEATGKVAPMEREMNEAGIWKAYRRGYFKAKGGTCYSFRQYPKWFEGREYYDYKDTQIANYVIQGESSFIVQAACGRVIRHLLSVDFYQDNVLPVSTVHDCIVTDCIDTATANMVGHVIKDIMVSTPKWLCEVIPSYKDWRYDSTPFTASGEYGISMMEMQHITEIETN